MHRKLKGGLMKKKIEKIYVILAIIIILTSIIIIKPLNNLDEIWNYNFARNTANGLMPYKDFNMIQMPLLPHIIALFLLIFGNQLIIMRILAIILCTGILLLSNKTLEHLEVNKQLRYAFLIFIFILFYDLFGIDYNFFVLFNILAIIYLELKKFTEKTSKKTTDILIGILAGICLCTKQTTGMFICIASLIQPILKVVNKEDIKKYIKQVGYRIIGILIPLLILIIYFTINGLWTDFIDYSILGIKTFSNSIPYSNLIKNENLIIKILSILIPIFIIISFIMCVLKRKEKEQAYQNLWIIMCYSIAEIIVTFPISDKIHFSIGIFPSLIGIMYIISLIVKNIKYKKIKQFLYEFSKLYILIFSIFTVILSCNCIYQYLEKVNEYTQLDHFKYIPIEEGQLKAVKEMEEYIVNNDKKVHILDSDSALYTIPINMYQKNYDMFLKGNLGKSGEEGIIENIKNEDEVIYLIKNNKEKRNWQNPEKVREYIINNLNKTGEILYFDIYEK